MATISEIEQAIIDHLTANLAYLKTAGPIQEFLSREADELAVLAPAVFVTYAGGTYSNPCMNTLKMERAVAFSCVIVVRNYISQSYLLHGQAGVKQGVYEVLEDVRTSLTGQDFGLSIRPLLPVQEDAIGGDKNVSIYGLSFETATRG